MNFPTLKGGVQGKSNAVQRLKIPFETHIRPTGEPSLNQGSTKAHIECYMV